MVMTRIMLPSDYGIYSNFLYITAMLSPLFFLKSDVPVARRYSLDPGGTAEYIGTIVILCSGITMVSAAVLWFSQAAVFQFTGIDGGWQMLIIITCWTYGLLLIVLAILQIEMRAYALAFSRIMPAMSCELFTMGAVLAAGGGWRTALAAYTAVSVLWSIVFIAWLQMNGHLKFRFMARDARDFLTIGVPLIPLSIGFMSVQISAQFVLTHYWGPGEVGIYSAANQFSLGVWLLALASQQAFLPWLFKILKQDDPKQDYKIFIAVTGIIAVLAACTLAYIVVLKFVFPLVIGQAFTSGGSLLAQLAWANFFLGVQMVMICFLYYRRQTLTSALAVCLAAACGLTLGIWYIPTGGVVAAATVTEVSAALAAVFTAASVIWAFASTFRNGGRTLLVELKAFSIRRRL
jgi:O-antigen/teichoic acid export membrane protein